MVASPDSSLLSSSGLCVLTISSSVLEKDPLLQLIIKCASSRLHVSIEKPTKGGGGVLSLSVGDSIVLRQRLAILRALAGPALHYALDSSLLGGHGSAAGSSPQSTLAMASLQAWMSHTDFLELEQLERHLERHAFLVPSFACTLADYHVALLLLQNHQDSQSLALFPNVSRWLRTCHSQLQGILGSGGLPPLSSELISDSPQVLPIFYNGTEDIHKILAQSSQPESQKQKQPASLPEKKNKGQEQEGTKKNQQPQETSKKQPKKKQPQQQQQQQPQEEDPDTMTISAMDLRIGQITKVWHHEEADKLFCEEIHLGDELGTRQVASGLREHYKLEDMQDRKVVVLCNLKKRNLIGFPSHGMVLCAVNSDRSQVQLITPPEGAKVGDKVVFEGFEKGDPEPENKVAKKKIWEKLAPELKTNDKGQVVWKGALSKSPDGGTLTGFPNAQVS